MGGSGEPAATIRPGTIRAIFDHLALSLTADGQSGPPRLVFSHYRFRWSAEDSARAPRAGTVTAGPIRAGEFRERLTAGTLTIDVEVADLAPPVMASGPAPRLPSRDIVSVLIEARAARASLDGQPIAGEPFSNEAWVPWLGRPLRSAVLAVGEVLVDRD